MSKYSRKTVFNYVMGNDIDNELIEALENDWEFMKEVFEYTNDKKIYDLCDEKLHYNLDLIKYLINKYSYDKKFVLKVSSNFLKKSKNQLDKLEIQILLEDLFKDDEIYEDKLLNKVEIYSFYVAKKVEYESELTDDKMKEFLQLGFYWFFECYKDRTLITDFIAKKMIDDIFDFRNTELEKLIHSIYQNKKQINDITPTKFIINYISNYDYALANYISVHIDIIENLKKSLDRIFENFENYNECRYKDVVEGVIEYIEDYSKKYNYSEVFLLVKYISEDLKNKDIWIEFNKRISYILKQEDEFGEYEKEIIIKDDFVNEDYYYEIDFYNYEKVKNNILYIKLKENVEAMLKNNEIYDRYNDNFYQKKSDKIGKVLEFSNKR